MAAFRCWMLFLVNAAAELLSVSEAEITSKYVCPGDSVQAFQNIAFDRCNALVSIHINGKRNTEIATWLWQNCTLNETRLDAYKDRVFLDQNGTITIHNFRHFDQGKYVLISKKNALPSIQEVQIIVMVAPSNECKPTIYRLGNTLIASLKDGGCGTPVPTLYWKGYEGVSDTNGPKLMITPGTESRTYYACIQGPAVQCVKNQMPLDNCSPLEGSTSRTMSSEYCCPAVVIVVIVVMVIVLIVSIMILILIMKRRKRNPKKRQRYKTPMQSVETHCLLQEMPTSATVNESNVDTQCLLKEMPTSATVNKSNVQRHDILREAKTSIAVKEFNYPTPRAEKASTKHEKIGPYGDCCRFCGQGRKAMFILSCEHFGRQYMPACFECGNSYLPCRRCRALHATEIFG